MFAFLCAVATDVIRGRRETGTFAVLLSAFIGVFLAVFAGTGAAVAAQTGDEPMVFSVVRSSQPGCEPICAEWISAQGKIVADSPSKLRKVLKKLGKRRLPVLIQSPGGDVTAALAIGRMIRERKLDVAVAGTRFEGCPLWQQFCAPEGKGKDKHKGLPSSAGVICFSACPFVLASGTRRLASPWSYVGVHQITTVYGQERLTYRMKYRIVNGKKKIISKKVVGRKVMKGKTTSKLSDSTRKELLGYFKEMGVGAGLLDALLLAPPESINVLNDRDLLKLNLVTQTGSATGLVASALCTAAEPAGNCFDEIDGRSRPARPAHVPEP